MNPLSLAKFVWAVINEARAIFAQPRKEKPGLVEVGTLLELYGSATRLVGLSKAVNRLLAQTTVEASADDKRNVNAFLSEIENFICLLRKLNTCVIDIYYPQLSRAIASLCCSDMELLLVERERFRLNLGVPPKDIANIWAALDHPHPLEYHAHVVIHNVRELACDKDGSLNAEELRQPCRELESLALRCRDVIGTIVRENWDFKDFQNTDPAQVVT